MPRTIKLIFVLQLLSLVYCIELFAQNQNTTVNKVITEELKYKFLVYADSGRVDMLRYLIEIGVNPNTANYDGTTALIYAAQRNHLGAVNLLIEKGADVNAKPYNGNTALHAASRYNNDSIAEILILNKANVNAINEYGSTALHLSAGYGYPFLTQLLIYYGATVDTTDYYGNTPLLTSIYAGANITSQILIENGANVNKPDKKGYTPLMVAAQFNDTLLTNLLISYEAEINKRNNDSITALAIAIQFSANEVAKRLIALGAAKNEFASTKTYTQLALLSGNSDIAQFLKPFKAKSYKPKVAGLQIFTTSLFNQNDFFLGGGFGIYEVNYNLNLNLSLGTRLASKPILIDGDDAYYQYYESRRFVSITIDRPLVETWSKSGTKYGILVGLNGLVSFANYNYNNARTIPYKYWGLSPTAGLFMKGKSFFLLANGQVMNILQTNKSIFWISLSTGFRFDLTKPKVTRKNIEWL
jgi:ankyrin repeat protein